MFGQATDPFPFIASAYTVATLLIVGYSAWQIQLRKKLRRLEQAIDEGQRK